MVESRVFMTGGYGCIGSWVAKQLVETGREVWIYDLKEDTHRLDLILEPDQRTSVHFIAGDVSDPEAVRSAVERVGATHLLHLAGLQTPTCRANPILGARVNVIGTLAVFEAALALKDQVQAGRLCQLRGGPRSGRSGRRQPPGRRGPAGAVDAIMGPSRSATSSTPGSTGSIMGSRSIGLRPWTVYGVGRDFGMTSEPTKAIKAVAVGRPYRISYGGKQDLQYVGDVATTFVRALDRPFEGADAFNLNGAVEPIESFVGALCDVVPAARESRHPR